MSEEKKNEVLSQDQAISEQEFSDAAGGKRCMCALGGGGEADWGEKTCACVGGGGGQDNAEGGATGKNVNPRCVCVVGGYGNTIE